MKISRYPGVVPFGDTKVDLIRFFGRNKEVDDLLHRLLDINLLVLYGKSGLGKTSLLNAGLFPELRECDFLPLLVRFNQQVDSATRPIKVIDVFAESIQKVCDTQGIDYTEGDKESLWEFFKTSIFKKNGRLLTPILILDQFEDAFTLQKEPYRREIAEQLGELISRRLPEYVREKLLRGEILPFSEKPPEVKILVSLREEYLGMLQELSPQIPDILQSRYRLLGLSQESAKDAVVKPAKLDSEDFDTRPFDYAPETLDAMMKDARNEEGAVEPFVLQIFCQDVEKQVKDNQAMQDPATSSIVVDSTYFGEENRTREEILASYYADNVARAAQKGNIRERDVRDWFDIELLNKKGVRLLALESVATDEYHLTSECLNILDEAYLIRRERRQGINWCEVGHDQMVSSILKNNESWRKENLMPFQLLADLWYEQENRNDKLKLLIGGSQLEESLEWVSNNSQKLTEEDETYLEECIDAQEASQKVAEQERQKELRLQLVPQALAAQAFVQRSRGYDELAGLLACQSVLFQRSLSTGIPTKDQISEIATNDQLLYEILSSICTSRILETNASEVLSLAFSPDECTLATGHKNGKIHVCDVFERCVKPKILPEQNGRISSLCFATYEGCQMLVSGCSDHMVRLYRLDEPSKAPIELGSHSDEVTSVAFVSVSNEDIVASGGCDGTVRLWRLGETNHELDHLSVPNKQIWSVAFSPDGKTIAAGVQDGKVWLWYWKENRPIKILDTYKGEAAKVFCVAFSPNGRWLAAACNDRLVRVWDVKEPQAKLTLLFGHKNSVNSVSFSPDGLLVSGGKDQTIRLWNLDQPETPVAKVLRERQGGGVSSVVFSPNGAILAVGWWCGVAKTWGVLDLEIVRYTNNLIYAVAFSPDGKTLAAGSRDWCVHLWELDKPGQAPKRLTGHGEQVRAVVFSPQDSNCLVSASYDTTLCFWDLSEPNPPSLKRRAHDSEIRTLAFNPKGNILASADRHGIIWLWSMVNKEDPVTIWRIESHSNGVWTVAFNKEGTLLAAGGDDGKVQFWEIEETVSGVKVGASHTLGYHEKRVRSVSFSPDGVWLASGGDGVDIKLWPLKETNTDPVILKGPRFGAGAVSFSPQNILAVGGWDYSIRLWRDFHELAIPIVLYGHSGPVSSVAFSEDGRRLATGGHDCTVRLWVGGLDTAANRVCELTSRNLSLAEWNRFVGPDIPYQRTCSALPSGPGAPPDAPAAE